MRTGGIVKAKGEIVGRCAPIVFFVTDRLLTEEAVFFACGSQECEPYNPIVALG